MTKTLENLDKDSSEDKENQSINVQGHQDNHTVATTN